MSNPEEFRSVSRSTPEDTSSFSSQSTPSTADIVPTNKQWHIIRTELRALTYELDSLEKYFMKAACSMDISDFKTNEIHKLLHLYKELNKLAQSFNTGYSCQKLESREDFENELKIFKNEFKFVLKVTRSPRRSSENPKLISEQIASTADTIRDVKLILTTHFTKQLNWQDILEQVAAIVLFVSDILSDWFAVLIYLEIFNLSWRTPQWYALVKCLLTFAFIHLTAFRTACTYVSNKLLIPFYTVLPLLPLQIMLRQLYTCFKFKRKPHEIQFEEIIHYHAIREDLIFIYSSQVLLESLPQLILQGHTLLNIYLYISEGSPTSKWLALTWATSLLNSSYACSISFEFMNSRRLIRLVYFTFFMFYESSRGLSLIMLFVAAPWWFSLVVSSIRFLGSLVWLCKSIDSSYSIPISLFRRIVSCFNGSVILTSIPILCHLSEFSQFWINALDVFGCLTLSVVCGFPLFSAYFFEAVWLVVSVILSWFAVCIIGWNTKSLRQVLFENTPEQIHSERGGTAVWSLH